MNLTSCEHCGVVIDTNKKPFPTDLFKDEEDENEGWVIDPAKAVWHDGGYKAIMECPVCKGVMIKDEIENRDQ